MESLTQRFKEVKVSFDERGYTDPIWLNNLDKVERLRQKFKEEEPLWQKALIKAKLGLKGRQLNG